MALPELIQHAVEIHLGMFAVDDALTPGRETEIRMAFGIVKVAGLCLAIVLTLRFWASGGKLRAALLPSPAQIRQMALVIAVLLILGLPDLILQPNARQVFDIVNGSVAIFWLLWLLGTLAGSGMTLARSIGRPFQAFRGWSFFLRPPGSRSPGCTRNFTSRRGISLDGWSGVS